MNSINKKDEQAKEQHRVTPLAAIKGVIAVVAVIAVVSVVALMSTGNRAAVPTVPVTTQMGSSLGVVTAIEKVTLPDGTRRSAAPSEVYLRGYDNAIAVFVGRPTAVYVWDYGTVDGDVAGINGVAVPITDVPVRIVLPPGVTHIVLTAVKDGTARGITIAARSTAGSVTLMYAEPGKQVIVPCNPVM